MKFKELTSMILDATLFIIMFTCVFSIFGLGIVYAAILVGWKVFVILSITFLAAVICFIKRSINFT